MNGFDTNTISRSLSRHGVKAAWAFACICLLLVLISIAWQIRSDIVAKERDYAPQKAQTIVARKGPSYRMSDIIGANLFGDPTPTPVVKQAPKTTLDLKLQGLLWATQDGVARAIIQSGRGKTKLYSIGERIAGAGASVKEIRNNEVILDRNGASESLPLNKLAGGGDIISYVDGSSAEISRASFSLPSSPQETSTSSFERGQSSSTPRANRPRKVRKPNFSGLDRALEKLGEG